MSEALVGEVVAVGGKVKLDVTPGQTGAHAAHSSGSTGARLAREKSDMWESSCDECWQQWLAASRPVKLLLCVGCACIRSGHNVSRMGLRLTLKGLHAPQ